MRRWTVLLAAAVLVLSAACGGDGDRPESPIQQAEVDQAEVDVSNYDAAYIICEGIAAGEIDGDIPWDPGDNRPAYAQEYASQWEDPYRQAHLDGCLDALEGRPKDPPG